MPIPLDAQEILDNEFLEIRAKLLQLAASFDRLARAERSVVGDPRMEKIQQALSVLSSDEPCRAERLQMIFSLPYDGDWQGQFGLNGQAGT